MVKYSLSVCVALGVLLPDPVCADDPKFSHKITLNPAVNRPISAYLTALSRDGKQLAYRNGPDTIGIYEPLTGKLLRTLTISEKEVGESLYFTPDGKHLLLKSMQLLRFVDPTTGKITRTVGVASKFDIYSHIFNWNTDGSRVTDVQQQYDFGFKPKVKVWDATAPKALGEIDVAQNGGNRIEALSGDGKIIATTGRFHRKQNPTDEDASEYVEIWDTDTRKRKGRIHLGKDVYGIMLGLNADGKYLVVVSENNDGAVIWDLSTEKKVATLGRFPGGFGQIYFSPDDKHFAIQAQRGYTVVYETTTGKKVAELQGSGTSPVGVGFTPDGDIITCYADQSQIYLGVVNKKEQPKLARSVGHSRPVVVTHFSKDAKSLLTVGGDLRVIRWDLETGKPLETVLDDSARTVYSVDKAGISPDGKLVYLILSGDLVLYNLETKKKVAELQANIPKFRTRFKEAYLSEDGKKIFARGEAQELNRGDFQIVIVGAVAAWNTADGSEIAVHSGKESGEALFEKHFGKEKLAPAVAASPSVPLVTVGPLIRDPWMSPFNAMGTSIGNKLTLTDPASKKVLLDQVLYLNGGRGISFSSDGKKVALPMLDNSVQIFGIP